MLKIDTVSVANPKDFKVTIENVYGTEDENALGEQIADRVAVKRSIEITWGLLSQSDCSAIITALGPVFIDLEYPDPNLGVVTKEFKVGPIGTPKSLIVRATVMWDELSCVLRER